jgi:MFS family permease
VFLPFTIILGVLSRSSGRMADRVGARWPLIIGPAIVACGFVVLLWAGNQQAVWRFLLALTVVGFGMAVTVAPLTTLVVNAVPESETGIASGINNAVASVASLLVISALGTVALSAYHQALTKHPGGLTESISQSASISMFRAVMTIAVVLCFASAGVAGMMIKDERTLPLPRQAAS